MPNKIASPLLILALFSCPLWCSWASAHGITCCGKCVESVETTCSESVCDCCRKQNPESPQKPDQGDAGNDHCQGICGGAVIDSAVDVELPLLLSLDCFVDFTAIHASEIVSRAHPLQLHSSPPVPVQGTLRALHILILC